MFIIYERIRKVIKSPIAYMSSEKEVSGSSGAVSTTGSPLHESEWTPPCEQLSAPGRDELVTLRRPPRRVQVRECESPAKLFSFINSLLFWVGR